MTPKRLLKLKAELSRLRRAQAKAADIEKLAKALGRRKVTRGKEPMWESTEFPELFVLAIPHHGSRDLAVGTRRSILDQLEEDVLAWEERLNSEGDEC